FWGPPPRRLAGGHLATHVRRQLVFHRAAHASLLAGLPAPACHASTARATDRVARWMRLFTAASLAESPSAMSRYDIPSKRQSTKAVRSRSLSRCRAPDRKSTRL